MPTWNFLLQLAENETAKLLRQLPPAVRAKARALPVTYEPRPGPALVAAGIEADTLGLFTGASLRDSETGCPLPAQITLFLRNIWDAADGDEQDYRDEIRTTLLHELGHYLGLEESDLEVRNLE